LKVEISPGNLGILLGLSFFLGLAFEEFYSKSSENRPGGVRTFPILALLGAGAYALEPTYGVIFAAGLLVVGWWLSGYYRNRLTSTVNPPDFSAELMIPVCNLMAYLLGPLVLSQPQWIPIGFSVATVLFLGAREQLHRWARMVPSKEITTLGKFLVLTGVILPILPRAPITELTTLTPYQVWLAVVVVCALSYASYLLQRYVSRRRGILIASILGGLYSSTATTIVLARRMRAGSQPREIRSAIVLATSLMYLRIGAVVACFDVSLAFRLAPVLGGLCLLGLAEAWLLHLFGGSDPPAADGLEPPGNPLELSAALIFAGIFVVVSLLSIWARSQFGQSGLFGLAALVGVADVDPFVLAVAQGGVAGLSVTTAQVAILIAASANDLLKAAYAIGFARTKAIAPAIALLVLSAAGIALALWGIR